MCTLKGAIIILLIVSMAVLFIIPANVSARLEGRWALQAGDILTGEDFSVQHPCAELFHQQTSNVADRESADLSFPGSVPFNSPGGPAQGVSLALPSISQQVNQSVDTSSTGFFKANWAYISDLASSNLGAMPLGVGLTSQRPFRSQKMLGSEFIWPLMTPISASGLAGTVV